MKRAKTGTESKTGELNIPLETSSFWRSALVPWLAPRLVGLGKTSPAGEEAHTQLWRSCPVGQRPDYDRATDRFICYHHPFSEPLRFAPYGTPCCLPYIIDNDQTLRDIIRYSQSVHVTLRDLSSEEQKAEPLLDPIFRKPVTAQQSYWRSRTAFYPWGERRQISVDEYVELISFLQDHNRVFSLTVVLPMHPLFLTEEELASSQEEEEEEEEEGATETETVKYLFDPETGTFRLQDWAEKSTWLTAADELKWMLANSKTKVPDWVIIDVIDSNLSDVLDPQETNLQELISFARAMGRDAIVDVLGNIYTRSTAVQDFANEYKFRDWLRRYRLLHNKL